MLNLIQLVKTRCLVPVKTKGKSPKKLFIKTKMKSLIINRFREVGINSPRVTLISLFNDSHKLFILWDKALGTTQNPVEINRILSMDSQFKESWLSPELGSKIEKRLSVIVLPSFSSGNLKKILSFYLNYECFPEGCLKQEEFSDFIFSGRCCSLSSQQD